MLDKKLLLELQVYVESHIEMLEIKACESPIYEDLNIFEEVQNSELVDFINDKRMPTFNQMLFDFIDEKGESDSDIYKKARVDRRHFSKIRSNPNYRPKKNTVVALALALELNKDEAEELLSSAGYSLSNSETFDLVIQFCLEKRIYDLHNVNLALDYFSLKPLGA